MKRFFLFIPIFLALYSTAYGNGPGVEVNSDEYKINLPLKIVGGLDASGYANFKQSYAHLVYEEVEEVFYNLTTTFRSFSSFATPHIADNMFSNESTIILGEGAGGDYTIMVSFGIEAQGGSRIDLGIFLNDTTILSSRSALFLGSHPHDAVFINLSGNGVAIDSGSLSDTSAPDDINLIISEGAGTPAFIIEFGFNNKIRFPKEVFFENILYDGLAAHEIEALARNCDGSYTDLRAAVKDFPASANLNPESAYLRGFVIPDPRKEYTCDGETIIRLDHTSSGNSNHKVYFDHIFLIDDHSSRSITFFDHHDLRDGDEISVRLKADSGDVSTWIDDVKFTMFKIGTH